MVVGVYHDQDKRCRPFAACIRILGKVKHLGNFATEEEAGEAFTQAAMGRDKNKKPKSSRYRGVALKQSTALCARPWKAHIKVYGTKKHLGVFATEEEAARAYDVAAKEYHGEGAILNFGDNGQADGCHLMGPNKVVGLDGGGTAAPIAAVRDAMLGGDDRQSPLPVGELEVIEGGRALVELRGGGIENEEAKQRQTVTLI